MNPMVTTQERVAQLDAAAGLRAFDRIADAWRLSVAQRLALLGGLAPATYFRWKKMPPRHAPPDLEDRLGYVVAMYVALHAILGDAPAADEWPRRANAAPLFGGNPPLELLTRGRMSDLIATADYLEAAALQ